MQITITAKPEEIADLVLALQGRQSADDAARLQEMFNRITERAKETNVTDEPINISATQEIVMKAEDVLPKTLKGIRF